MNKINDTFLRFTVCAQEPREVEQAFLGSIWTNHTRSGRRVWGFYLSSEQVLLTGCYLALGCLRLFDSSWESFEKRRAHTSCLEWQVWLSSAFTEAPERDTPLSLRGTFIPAPLPGVTREPSSRMALLHCKTSTALGGLVQRAQEVACPPETQKAP